MGDCCVYSSYGSETTNNSMSPPSISALFCAGTATLNESRIVFLPHQGPMIDWDVQLEVSVPWFLDSEGVASPPLSTMPPRTKTVAVSHSPLDPPPIDCCLFLFDLSSCMVGPWSVGGRSVRSRRPSAVSPHHPIGPWCCVTALTAIFRAPQGLADGPRSFDGLGFAAEGVKSTVQAWVMAKGVEVSLPDHVAEPTPPPHAVMAPLTLWPYLKTTVLRSQSTFTYDYLPTAPIKPLNISASISSVGLPSTREP
jgi:hypothetical protein